MARTRGEQVASKLILQLRLGEENPEQVIPVLLSAADEALAAYLPPLVLSHPVLGRRCLAHAPVLADVVIEGLRLGGKRGPALLASYRDVMVSEDVGSWKTI